MSLKRNLIANYLGQGWSGVIGLIFVPLYIQYLGIEAYGLIGFFAMLQAGLTLLDMGMSPTLNREMARFTAGAHTPQSIRDLLRSLESICFGLAILIGLIIWGASGWLATHWLRADKLSVDTIAQAIAIMGWVAALRFVEGIYRGAILGLQKQVFFNVVNAILSTMRAVGAIAVLAWFSSTIEAYFAWQGLISLVSVAILATVAHGSLPAAPLPPRFSRQALREIGSFAGGMMGIAFLALLLTQVDKVLLSRLLTLESFGYYMLATTVSSALHLMIVPISQGIYPQMVELQSRNDLVRQVSLYHQGSQLITSLTVPLALLIGFFAEGVIFLWSGDVALAKNVAPILAIMVLGTLMNGMMHMPYHMQLAHGWTSLSLKTNMIAVAIIIPAILLVVPRHGAVGAAWVWLVLNAGYVLISVHFMHQRLIPDEKWRWYGADILLPGGGVVVVMLLAKILQPADYLDRWVWLAFLASVGVLATLVSVMLAGTLRTRLSGFASKLGA